MAAAFHNVSFSRPLWPGDKAVLLAVVEPVEMREWDRVTEEYRAVYSPGHVMPSSERKPWFCVLRAAHCHHGKRPACNNRSCSIIPHEAGEWVRLMWHAGDREFAGCFPVAAVGRYATMQERRTAARRSASNV